MDDAKETLSKWETSPTLDLPFLSGDDDAVREAWEAASLPLRRDLLRLAINKVTVRKARAQGVKFVGAERITIHWADAA
ncbi:hypothetical protein BJF83_03760 [Nocardiopsis sp. CNR-923]|uniref:hypothetical protein n=1 Tax=Nocardiopsis sp. CNR-923 TaxID=1904965 RepID=UPI0009615D8A|nr:hypothetical protein [Nocardiopsis sp. CNR-923]OLT26021.1 hypothetical protein BJF83_03760 [Nocardiopsis sp. CNR-923]